MGRLFWKFFISILLAQLTVTAGVGITFWIKDQARERASASAISTSGPAQFDVDAAAATLAYGGSDALRALLGERHQHRLFAVDANGRELLGRAVAPAMLAQATRALREQGERRAVRQVRAADGGSYLIFMPADAARNSFGPPGSSSGLYVPEPGSSEPGGPPHGGPQHAPPDHYLPWFAPLIGATLASLLFAGALAWYFARPIRALRSAFEAAARGDLAARFDTAASARRDELSDLGRDFDRMSAQLRALMDGQRRLLHDVSHELRSPLARLQAAIGLAHQQPDQLALSLARIERESVRMDKLVGELLTLSRLEVAATPLTEHVSIAELIADVAADARFEAGARAIAIDLSGAHDAWVRGSAELLWRALENVVRNAVKYSPDGGTVEIALDVQAEQVVIRVLDRGPGIAEADLQAVFQPFFRANPGAQQVQGHGLGLAIAQRVATAHGGTIGALNRNGGGLVVELALPGAPAR